MRTAHVVALLVATFLAGGCRLDLTEIPPEASKLSLVLHAGWGRSVDMTVTLGSGRDGKGTVREIGNDSLILNGVAVPPDSVWEGYRRYTVSGLELGAPPLRIRAPSVLGVAESPPEIIVSPIGIVAPDTLVAARPGILEVRVAGVEAEVTGLTHVDWSVRIQPDTGNAEVLAYSGHTMPDSVLSVPTTLLPTDLTRGLMLVQGGVMQEYDSAGGAYQVQIERHFIGFVPFRIGS